MNEITEMLEETTTTTTTTPKGKLKKFASSSATNLKKQSIERVMNSFATELRTNLTTLHVALETIKNNKQSILQSLMPTNLLSTGVTVDVKKAGVEYLNCVTEECKVNTVYEAFTKEYEELTGKTFSIDSEIE